MSSDDPANPAAQGRVEWMIESTLKVPQHVVYRSFATEVVMLNLKTGKYHGLNLTAGKMLETLEREPTVGAATDRLIEMFDAPADRVRADVIAFCADLVERDLVELDSARP